MVGYGFWDILTGAIFVLASVFVGWVSLAILTFAVEIAAAHRALSALGAALPVPHQARLAVLVPAHDESDGLIPTLSDARGQLGPADRLLVVADNCSDDTAEVARRAGADVFERHEPRLRGKGYALSAGIAQLAADPPDIVVMVDADCRIAPGALSLLADRCMQSRRPAQANYIMHPPRASALRYEVAAFAWRVKNFARPLGLRRLGLPCQLTGSGMAFPWAVISSAKLASGNVVEDMALGIELAMRGEAALYCPEAEVSSVFPTSDQALETQRRRWEQGHFQTILRSAAPLLINGVAHLSLGRVALALDLAVPPLTSLVFVAGLSFAVSFVAACLGCSRLMLYILSTDLVLLAAALVLAWFDHGRETLPAAKLASLVPYLFGKLRIYRSILQSRGRATWIRTDRK